MSNLFYSITTACLSLLLAPNDTISYICYSHRQPISLVGSVVLSLAWICQVGFWTNCEELNRDNNGVMPWCPQYAMYKMVFQGYITTPVTYRRLNTSSDI